MVGVTVQKINIDKRQFGERLAARISKGESRFDFGCAEVSALILPRVLSADDYGKYTYYPAVE